MENLENTKKGQNIQIPSPRQMSIFVRTYTFIKFYF